MFKKIGGLLVTVLGGLLLVYSATRSLDFIMLTLPADRQILAYFGLAALDGGLVCWILAYLFGSRGGWQRAIAMLMILVDLVGAVAMFTLDTLYNTGKAGMTTVMTADELQTAVLALSGVIALNIAATVAHHLLEPDRIKEQAEEEAFGKVEDATLKQISKNADSLAAQIAPVLAADWIANTQARYLAHLNTRGAPGVVLDSKALPMDDSLHIPSNGWPVKDEKVQKFPFSLDWLKSSPASKAEQPAKGRQFLWVENDKGERERVYCMICRQEGKEWDTPKPCKHILQAESGEPVSIKSSEPAQSVASATQAAFGAAPAAQPVELAPGADVKQQPRA